MPHTIPDDLTVLVDQIVQPVVASAARKAAIREELLGHVLAAFEEELTHRRDPTAALRAVRRRFGEPRQLATEIQAALPRFDHWLAAVVLWLRPQSGRELLMRWLLVCVGVVVMLVGLGFVCPAVAHWRDHGQLFLTQFALLTLGLALMAGGVGSCVYGWKPRRA